MSRKSLKDFPEVRRIVRLCPPFYWLFCSPSTEYGVLKKICGFFYGLFLGLAFYEFILVDLSFTQSMAFGIAGFISLLMAFGMAFSSQIRCITLLTFPNFGGRVGRGVLKALVITFIISGPLENLSSNGKEVVRVFACTASLTFNLTKTRFELMFKPFTQALFGLKADVKEVKETIRSIRDVSAPISGEIEGESEMEKLREENDYLDNLNLGDTKRSDLIKQKYETIGEQSEAKRFEKEYLAKIEARCEGQFTKASKKCRKMFEKGYNTCYDTVTWVGAWFLCWPMKLNFVCNIAEALGGKARCDPSKDIDPGFGEGYSFLKQARSDLSANFRGVRLQYKLGRIRQLEDVRNARDTAVAVLHVVNKRKKLFHQILNILKRLLALIFLRIIVASQQYHDKYLQDIQFDNFYITRYFRRIDARRRKSGQHTLLPLKKLEGKKLVDPKSLCPLKQEREKIFHETLMLVFEMLTAVILIVTDRLFFEALDLVRRHAKIDYVQTGHHDMLLEVKGTGMIASLLRSIVKGFNVKKRIRIERSNEVCLPRPIVLEDYYLVKIFGTYFAIWIMILCQAYTLRLRRLICAFFYRKREKKRVLFLYNESLKRRRGFFRFMRKKILSKVRTRRLQENLNVFAVLRVKYPKYFDWLKVFGCARRKCLICEETEPLGKSPKFYSCPNCLWLYCQECWVDVGEECLVCKHLDSDTSSGFEEDLAEELSD